MMEELIIGIVATTTKNYDLREVSQIFGVVETIEAISSANIEWIECTSSVYLRIDKPTRTTPTPTDTSLAGNCSGTNWAESGVGVPFDGKSNNKRQNTHSFAVN